MITKSRTSAPRLTGPQLFTLVMTDVLGYRPKGREQPYRGIVEKELAADDGRLTEKGVQLLSELANRRPVDLAQMRRQALIEGLDIPFPSQNALLVLAGFAAEAGIGYIDTIPPKVQQAILRRGLLSLEGDLTPLGQRVAKAILKERQVGRDAIKCAA